MKEYTDDDFNFRLPNNNSILNAKKEEITWTGYKCRACGSSGSRPGILAFTKCPFCLSVDIEKFDSNSNIKFWISKKESMCELEGPYECPWCGGHVMLDATFLEQVELKVRCPYCGKFAYVEGA